MTRRDFHQLAGAASLAVSGSGLGAQDPPRMFPISEWSRRAFHADRLDEEKLAAGLRAIPHGGNIAVVQAGVLMASVGDVSDSHVNIYSAAKSLTALVFARLLQSGEVGYDDLLPRSDYPAGPRASYRHFLTMTSDYDLSPHAPGRHCAYNNVAVRFYGQHMNLRHFPGLSAAGVLQAALFDHIGHEDPVSLTRRSGVYGAPWAGGPRISARDLARVGLLVLARGRWRNTQVIPAEFCDALFRNQIPADATVSASTGTESKDLDAEANQQRISRMLPGNYSYGWWCNESGRLGADLPREVAYAAGSGGNLLAVVKPWRTVIAVTNDQLNERRPPVEAYLRAVKGALGG